MKKKTLSLALAVALLLSMTAVFTPVISMAATGDVVAWDISWSGGTSTFSWPASIGAGPYTIAHAGARLGTYTDIGTTGGLNYSYASANPKYENYFRVTPATGAPVIISLEGKIFGPNCYFYDSKYHTGEAAVLEINGFEMRYQEMSALRYGLFFKPGNYDDDLKSMYMSIGYVTSAYGLGKLPTDTQVGAVWCWPCIGEANGGANVTQVFWRSIENLQVVGCKNPAGVYNPDSVGDGFRWSASQAVSARRMNVLSAAAFDWDYGWASGGYVADSVFARRSGTVSGQQYYYRNNQFALPPEGCSWHTFFAGCIGGKPGGNYMGTNHVTSYDTVEKIREKPFIYLDGDEYKVFVPAWRNNSSGVSWGAGKANGGMGEGDSLDLLGDFYIAYADIDTADSINDALDDGKNLILTPGIYVLDMPIHVTQEDTVVLGLGFATLSPSAENKWGAMLVEDVDGVVVAGIFFDARNEAVYLLRVGEEERSDDDHQDNPIFLQDLFFRIGGARVETSKTIVACQINSNDVITDHFWIWRADHGRPTGWNINKCDYGLWVSGDRVTTNALFNEHHQKYSTYWEGEYGKLYFYQNETPYDPVTQSNYMSHKGTVNGYAQLKVANKVDNFYASGGGVYSCVFVNATNGAFDNVNGIEAPIKPNVIIENMMHKNLAGTNSTRYLINRAYATNNGDVYMLRYNGEGTQPVDAPDDPDFVTPIYDTYGLEEPFPQDDGIIYRVNFDLTNIKRAGKTRVAEDAPYSAILSIPAYGWYVPDSISVVMDDVALVAGVDYDYVVAADRFSAEISIPAVTGDVFITAAGVYDAQNITYALTNIASAGPGLLYTGLPLDATLTANYGYLLPDSIAVSMGGVALAAGTGYAYTLDTEKLTATVSVPAVTGAVRVTAAGVYNAYPVTYALTNLASPSPKIAIKDKPFTATIVGSAPYIAPDFITVFMDGEKLVEGIDYTYTGATGTFSIDAVTGALRIVAVGLTALSPMDGGTYTIKIGTGNPATYLTKPGMLYFDTATNLMTYWRYKDEGLKTIQLQSTDTLVRLFPVLCKGAANAAYTNTITVMGGRCVTVDVNSGPGVSGAAGCINFATDNIYDTLNGDMDLIISYNNGANLADGAGASIQFQGTSTGVATANKFKNLIITKEAGGVSAKTIGVRDIVVSKDVNIQPGFDYTFYNGANVSSAAGDGITYGNGNRSWLSLYNTSQTGRFVMAGDPTKLDCNFVGTRAQGNLAAAEYMIGKTTVARYDTLREYLDDQGIVQNFIVDYSGVTNPSALGSQYVQRGETLTVNLGAGASLTRVTMGLEPFVNNTKTQTVQNYGTGAANSYTFTRVDTLTAGVDYTYNAATGVLVIEDVTGHVTITATGGAAVVPADKEALLAAIEKFEALYEFDWTEASWADALAAYQAALKVYNNQGLTAEDQGIVDGAKDDLLAAIEALVSDFFVFPDPPSDGEEIYLVSLRTGKIVAADPGTFTSPTSNAMLTMNANQTDVDQYAKLTALYPFTTDLNAVLLRATNGYCVTVENTDYGDSKVRPRSPAAGASVTGWESLKFIPQRDGAFKILRPFGAGGERWISVDAGGFLVSVVEEPGDEGKFNWFPVNVQEDIYEIALDQSGTVTAPVDVKAYNTGTQPTGALIISLSGAGASAFTCWSELASIAVGDFAGFTVAPAAGLAAGAYTATVTVSGDNGISASFTVTYTAEDSGPSLPKDGDIIALQLASTGKYVQVDVNSAMFWTAGANANYFQQSMRPDQDTITNYCTFVVRYDEGSDQYFLMAENGYYVTMEGPGYGETKVRPRTGQRAVGGWEALKFILDEDDGAFKIQSAGHSRYVGIGTIAAVGGFPAVPNSLTSAAGTNLAAAAKFNWVKVPGAANIAIELDKDIVDFGTEAPGYAALTPATVTVFAAASNNWATGLLLVELSGTDAGAFTVDTGATATISGVTYNSINDLFVGEDAAVTVVPKTGLADGTYEATVTVRGFNFEPVTFNVVFVVGETQVEDPFITLGENQAMSIKLAVGASVTLDIYSNLDDLVFSCPTTYVIVDANGVVTGIKGGMAVITVSSISNPTLKVNVVVTVS